MASRVGRSIALTFLDRGIRRGWVVSSTPQPQFTPGKDPVPIVQEAGWVSGPVWTAENLALPGFDPQTVQPVVSRYTLTALVYINDGNPASSDICEWYNGMEMCQEYYFRNYPSLQYIETVVFWAIVLLSSSVLGLSMENLLLRLWM
jgi:hypothetical protein